MRSIPLGQYLPLDSLIHRLDPRTKLVGIVTLAILICTARDLSRILILFIFLGSVLLLSKLPVSLIWRGLRGGLFILLFTILVHSFFTPGRTLSSLSGFSITYEGLYRGVSIFLQLTALFLGGIIFTGTTPPLRLVEGFRWISSPLRFTRIPVGELSLIMAIAIRFIPTLISETERLIKIQRSRGIELSSGPIKKRIRSLFFIILPLFAGTFRRAEELALSMEVRCFRGMGQRTQLRKSSFKERDLTALFVLTILIFLVVLS